jgi:hypothetical protein
VPKRARHDLPAVQEKRARVVELRAKGWTWDRIAAEVGYSNGSAASKAWHTAIAQRPAMAVDRIREEAASRYEYLLTETVKDIEDPGPAWSAIGRLIVTEDGTPVPNRSVRTRAIDQARKLVTDYVRVNGAEHTQSTPILDARTQILVTQINADRAAKGKPPMTSPRPPTAPCPTTKPRPNTTPP